MVQALQQRGDDGGHALVLKLPKMPGAREARWTHLLCGEVDIAALQAAAVAPQRGESDSLLARLTALETTVANLRADNRQLHAHLANISAQLGITLEDKSPL